MISKPGKSEYGSTKSYRPILLLSSLSKVIEQIEANRLAAMGEKCLAISITQKGAKMHNSAIDALFRIIEITSETLSITKSKNHGRPPPRQITLTHDIASAFTNAAPKLLSAVMKQRKMPTYLIKWMKAFTSERTMSFLFDGIEEEAKPFLSGLPQGLPASPVLFSIYANAMLETRTQQDKSSDSDTSYVGDVTLIEKSEKDTFAVKAITEKSNYQIE